MGETLPNHAYVNLSLVGIDDNDSVQCHTDLDTCCRRDQGVHRGDWFSPCSELKLPFFLDGDFELSTFRGAQRVDLRRMNDVNMPSGIYRCNIATSAVHDDNDTTAGESVYVGLYASGGTQH